MAGYNANIEELTLQNSNFRQVLFTGPHSQLVLMSLKPNEEIGLETHPENDQFFRFEKGAGKVIIAGEEVTVADGSAVVVPAGSQHNVVNTSPSEELKLYTIYSPAHHPDGTIHATKEEALAAEETEHGPATAPAAAEPSVSQPPTEQPPAAEEKPPLQPTPTVETASTPEPTPLADPIAGPAEESTASEQPATEQPPETEETS